MPTQEPGWEELASELASELGSLGSGLPPGTWAAIKKLAAAEDTLSGYNRQDEIRGYLLLIDALTAALDQHMPETGPEECREIAIEVVFLIDEHFTAAEQERAIDIIFGDNAEFKYHLAMAVLEEAGKR